METTCGDACKNPGRACRDYGIETEREWMHRQHGIEKGVYGFLDYGFLYKIPLQGLGLGYRRAWVNVETG